MFRDPSFYLVLREKVVPYLRTYPSLKVWIPGCATGEEVYSIAILLREEGLLIAHSSMPPTLTRRPCARPKRASTTLLELPTSARPTVRPVVAPRSRIITRLGTTRRFSTRRCARACSSPTTASPPIASLPSYSSSRAVTSSFTSTPRCRAALSPCFGTRFVEGFPRPGSEGDAVLVEPCRRVHGIRARRANLPKAMTDKMSHESTPPFERQAPAAILIGGSAGAIEVVSLLPVASLRLCAAHCCGRSPAQAQAKRAIRGAEWDVPACPA